MDQQFSRSLDEEDRNSEFSDPGTSAKDKNRNILDSNRRLRAHSEFSSDDGESGKEGVVPPFERAGSSVRDSVCLFKVVTVVCLFIFYCMEKSVPYVYLFYTHFSFNIFYDLLITTLFQDTLFSLLNTVEATEILTSWQGHLRELSLLRLAPDLCTTLAVQSSKVRMLCYAFCVPVLLCFGCPDNRLQYTTTVKFNTMF